VGSGRFGRFLVLSIGTVFLLQFGWNLPMTVGILPTVGVELPFISGGSQQAMYLALVGLTLSVFRRKTTTAKI
jgi:cell division protein FtsW (lipid II flippase)